MKRKRNGIATTTLQVRGRAAARVAVGARDGGSGCCRPGAGSASRHPWHRLRAQRGSCRGQTREALDENCWAAPPRQGRRGGVGISTFSQPAERAPPRRPPSKQPGQRQQRLQARVQRVRACVRPPARLARSQLTFLPSSARLGARSAPADPPHTTAAPPPPSNRIAARVAHSFARIRAAAGRPPARRHSFSRPEPGAGRSPRRREHPSASRPRRAHPPPPRPCVMRVRRRSSHHQHASSLLLLFASAFPHPPNKSQSQSQSQAAQFTPCCPPRPRRPARPSSCP